MKRLLTNIKSRLKNTSISNFLYLSLNQGTNVLVALIITPYLFQTLGEEEFGLVNLGLTVIMLFSILVNYGFHLNGPKRLALLKDDSDKKALLINEVIVTRLTLSGIVVLIIVVLTKGLGLFGDYNTILLFSSILLLNEAIFPMFILQGLDRISWISKANAVSKFLYLIFIVIIVRSSNDSKCVNFLFGGTALTVNIVLLMMVYRVEQVKLQWVKLKAIGKRLKENFHFFISTIAGHISIHGGLAVLSNFVTDFELGQYALAQRVAFLLRMVPVFLTQSILQNASRLYYDDRKHFHTYLRKAHLSGIVITLLIGIVISVLSPWVVRVVGGEFVTYSALVLRMLAFLPFLGMLNVGNMIKILAGEHKDVLAKSTWITASIMLFLSITGSYLYGGYGLAGALMISELTSFIVHHFMLKLKLNNR